MKVVETWQTERQDDSAVGLTELDQSVAHVRVLTGRAVHAVHVVGSKGTSIGRPGGDCDFIVDDGRMSRKHARIERSVAGWQIQDLMSRNGGFVNGRGLGRGGRAALSEGAVLRLGDTLMSFRATIPTTDGRADSAVFPGVSPVAVGIRRRIDALASGDGHVLIFGETGTGKESIAKMIGEQRAPHPFVTLNSAELSRDLARSELFGHVRGAYTHATSNRPGLVDKAGDGVLFLDEIGELSLDVQAELLRFLEDGSYRPVGSTELRRSCARVVAATHVDLDRAVQNNKFRRDLLARLRASNEPLELPALRERKEDILGWTQLFFHELGRDAGPTPWTVGALECLLLYPWTENLRELHRVVGHAAEQSPGFPCGTEHLPAKLRAHRGTLRSPSSGAPYEEPTPANDPQPPSEPPPPDIPMPDPTRLEIEEALRKTAGRMRTAAQVLGIDRRKLYRLCDNSGIDYRLYRAQSYRDDEEEDRDDE
jgi:DNA-binding NtrC family response regulator